MKNPNFLEFRPLPISNTQIMYHARQDLLLRLRFLDNHLKVLVLQNNLIIILFHLCYIPSKKWW